ncbi:MAG: FAD-dependent monooxygenase [Chloroflexi bacterium]|nr:FAD-dependent monooxygenase [Chloroflexota bacterium]MBV9598891.1 FAD-dependent monooxygenase [Chloroflexota bacterium]
MKVLIVGAGIGGLCTAIALRRWGIDCLVLEREPELRPVGAGLCLWHNAMQAMLSLGLAEQLHPLAAQFDHQENRTWDGHVLESQSFVALAQEVGAQAITLQRSDLQRVLLANLEPATLRLGARVVSYSATNERIEVQLSDGGSETGDCLVGADGIHSAIRAQLSGLEEPVRYAGYTCCRGLVAYRPEWFAKGWFVQGIGEGARFGVTHSGNDQVYWWTTFNAPQDSADAEGGRKAELLRRYAGWAPPIVDILAATRESAILRNDIVDREPTDDWGEGPVTLLGDAAHPMTPNMAQGACQAIEDAVVLANRLAEVDVGGVASALRRYEQARQERTATIVRQSWLIGARGQGLLDPETALRAFKLADRDSLLRYVPR